MVRRAVLMCCVAVLVLAGSACGGESGGAGAAGRVVEGEYLGSPDSTFPLVDATVVRLVVTNDSLSLTAGCNTLGAPFRIDGDELIVESVASTMMGCVQELMDQDARLTAFVESRPSVTASPDGFTLTSTDGVTLVFVDRVVADPDRSLEDTRWVLDGVTTGEAAVSAVGFETVELVFSGGRVEVVTGCSVGAADYEVDGDAVVLGPLELSPAPVGCVPGVRDAEAALAEVFGGLATATVRADALELRRGDVGLSLRER